MKLLNYSLLIFVILAFCPLVNAVGISGTNLNRYGLFEPDSVYSFDYILVASKTVENNYEVLASHDLMEYVVFDKTRFENVPKGSLIPFTGRIEFPSELSPGWHHAYICVIEDCPGGASICGRGKSCAQLNFMSLHPGIMPIVSLSVPNTNEGAPLDMIVTVENLGKEDIQKASGRVEIRNIDAGLIGTAFLNSLPVKSAEKTGLSATLDTVKIPPGNYSAQAFVDSDGIERIANASFRIGTLNVIIKGYTNELTTGSIKRFVTTVESDWNDPLNIYADISIFDENRTSVNAKSTTGLLKPMNDLELEAFIDTSGLEEKEYNVHIDVYYAEKKSSVDGKINLIAPPSGEIPVEAEEPQEVEKPSGISSTMLTVILVIVVVLLTVVNIFLAIYKKKKE